ncbi:DUF6802 family protein [Rhodococcus sp. ACPA1]|uniref:DUF6802 family protein n=1 Tax=Rhodococcus sp. ACPA1 TaxID=2028572 RepID=UPI00211BEFC7|nr:DUF6802 family protein [Rhodococcus sp. ACPA1]
MATTESFLVPDVPDLDPNTFGHDSGAVTLTDPTHDIDGDGVLDTQTVDAGDAVVVASDLDSDGEADHLRMIHEDGAYSSWIIATATASCTGSRPMVALSVTAERLRNPHSRPGKGPWQRY